MRGLHRVLAAALRAGAEVSRVAEHLSQRNESVDLLRAAAGLEALDLTTAGVEVADHVAHVAVGHGDLQLAHRLHQAGVGLRQSGLVGQLSGGLECDFGGVNGVIGAIIQNGLQIHHRITGQRTVDAGLPQALFHSGEIVLGHRAAEHLLGKDHVILLGLGLEADPDIAELTAAAGLLAAILREAAFHTGFYRAGCEPLSARIAIGGVSVDPVLFCQAAEALSAAKPLPRAAAELAAAACCFGAAGCKLAVVELPDAGLASALPQMPVCAVTAIGPDGVSRSVERLAALAAGVMRKDAVCVTAPEQPKAVLSELVVAAAKAECELVVPDAEDITFLEAEKFTSKVDYGGYTAPLAFLGRHAAGNAAVAVELALALWRKGFEIPDEAILAGLAAVENRSSIRVLSQKPLIILDACRTPQQAAALLRVLNMAKVRHMSAVIGLTGEEGAEAFFSVLESGLTPEEQKKDKGTMPGMSENPFDKVFLVAPAGTEAALAERLTEKARYHFDAVFCPTLAEAVEQAKANSRRGLLVCGSEAIALEAEKLLSDTVL